MCLFDNKIDDNKIVSPFFFFRPIEVKKHEKSGESYVRMFAGT